MQGEKVSAKATGDKIHWKSNRSFSQGDTGSSDDLQALRKHIKKVAFIFAGNAQLVIDQADEFWKILPAHQLMVLSPGGKLSGFEG